MKARRVVALGCLMAAMTSLAGCGLPVDASPQPIPPSEVPPALTVTNTTVISTPVVHGSIRESIYLIAPDGTQLIEADRYLRPPPTAQGVLDALEGGPTPREFDEGIGNAIPTTANLVVQGLSNGDLTVQLDSSYLNLLPDQAPLYFAQIVWSVTALPTIKEVFFVYGGLAVPPEIGNGSQATTDYGVNRSDYDQLAPAPG
ncbi:MAG: GerMN domain-containing protein [Acidimicrobiales bacterium]